MRAVTSLFVLAVALTSSASVAKPATTALYGPVSSVELQLSGEPEKMQVIHNKLTRKGFTSRPTTMPESLYCRITYQDSGFLGLGDRRYTFRCQVPLKDKFIEGCAGMPIDAMCIPIGPLLRRSPGEVRSIKNLTASQATDLAVALSKR